MSNSRQIGFFSGAALILLGFISTLINFNFSPLPSLFQCILEKELSLSASSTSFKIWQSNPVPIFLDFYFFNWTNPNQIEINGTKPQFVEMGPYRFKEMKRVVKSKFHENGTISYLQERRWFFDGNISNGSLTDKITTLNAVALSAAATVAHWHWIHQTGLSAFLGTTDQKIHETKTVSEFLFEGYENPLLNFAKKMPMIKIPYDKFGWFYNRNGSDLFDGHFNMDTGVGGIDKLGKIYEWQYSNRTTFYKEHCAMLNGTPGSLFPPVKSKREKVTLFSPDLCRSISLDFSRPEKVEGVSGYRFVGADYIVDNGTIDPSNLCFCNGECVPSGVMNVTSCRKQGFH